MATLITVNDIKKIVSNLGIKKFFSMLIQELENDFARWNEFQKIPRVATHFPQGVIELMPICDADFYTFKYVNGHPNNPFTNKQTVVAMGCLADVRSGYPLLISEMTLLTAFRTAATAALASRFLARKNSHTLGIIGTGAQAEFLVLALWVELGITNIKYLDLDVRTMKKFAQNLSSYPLNLEMSSDAKKLVESVDLIVTATAAKKKVHVIKNEWLRDGVHINGMGGDCPGKTELDPEIIKRSKIVVEYLPQTIVEGEIQNLDPAITSRDNAREYTELWEIISGRKKGRENDNEITLFDSVGFALEDYSILKLVYRLAKELKIGEKIYLLPDLENPKDLFSTLFN